MPIPNSHSAYKHIWASVSLNIWSLLMLDAVWINTLKLWSISALFCITILVKYFLHSAVSVIAPVIYSFALHIKTSNHVPLNWMTRVSVYKNIFVPSYIYRFQWSNNCRVICVVHSHNLPHFSFGPPPQLHLHRVKMIHQSKNKNEWAACTFVVTVWRHYEHIVAQMWDSPVVELNPKIYLSCLLVSLKCGDDNSCLQPRHRNVRPLRVTH